MNGVPSHDDVATAFARVRADAQASGDPWGQRHPLSDFLRVADQVGTVTRDCERMAAYRLHATPVPLGYYDDTIEKLETAIARLQQQRAIDHGDAPRTVRS